MKATMDTKLPATMALAMMALVIGVVAFRVAGSAVTPLGCESVPLGSIAESATFTPADQQRGRGRESAIVSIMPRLATIPATAHVPPALDGLPLQWTSSVAANSVYMYYLDAPLGDSMTTSDFLSAGGIAFTIEPRDGGGSFADSLPGLVGDRATAIQLGQYSAQVTWADPTRAGVRSHNLYWADDLSNFALIAVRGPEDLVNLGRTIACA